MDRHKSRGFTLLELMVVVIILGVLAAIAVVSFTGQYQYSKSSEVQALLRDIGAKQEAYKAEFGQYLNVSGQMSIGNRRPLAAPRDDFGFEYWDPGAIGDPIGDNWRRLGFAPSSAVRFAYVVVAGLPGQNVVGVPAGLNDNRDHWWAAMALGNYDTDGCMADVNACTQYYLSNTQNVMGVVNEGE
jgi:type IV pilus assembly protein PilA